MIHYHDPLNQLALSEAIYRRVWGKNYPIWKNKEEKTASLNYPAQSDL